MIMFMIIRSIQNQVEFRLNIFLIIQKNCKIQAESFPFNLTRKRTSISPHIYIHRICVYIYIYIQCMCTYTLYIICSFHQCHSEPMNKLDLFFWYFNTQILFCQAFEIIKFLSLDFLDYMLKSLFRLLFIFIDFLFHHIYHTYSIYLLQLKKWQDTG